MTVEAGANCASSSAVKITFWAWVPGLGRAVDAFNKTHPGICVTQEDVGAGDPEYVAITNALKAGSGAPDVAEVEYDELPSFEVTKSVDNLVPYGANNYKSDFVPWAWQEVSQGSAVYAIPGDAGPMAFYYNSALLAKYQITPPTTWARVRHRRGDPAQGRPVRLHDELLRHRPAVDHVPDGAGQRLAVHLHRRQQRHHQLDRPGADGVRQVLGRHAVRA